MSFSNDVKEEVRIKYFTFKNRHSKIHTEKEKIENVQLIIDSFLKSGFVSDPKKTYHLEFICDSKESSDVLSNAISHVGLNPKYILRKNQHVVYLKDSGEISDLLTIIGAHNAVLYLENEIILKEMRENIQRQVNCETANLQKTVSASVKQINDIRFIMANMELDKLPQSLIDVCKVRLEYPDATLTEISDKLGNGISKSGVNHRFRKISEIAERLRSY